MPKAAARGPAQGAGRRPRRARNPQGPETKAFRAVVWPPRQHSPARDARPPRVPAGAELRGRPQPPSGKISTFFQPGADLSARSQAALVMAMVAAAIKLPEDLRPLRPAKRYEPLVPDGPSS